MKTKIRKVKIGDIPRLVDGIFDFFTILKTKGAKDIVKDDEVLRGGITIKLGNGFSDPNWYCVVAERGEELIAFMIVTLEFCSPIDEHFKCVRVQANYLKDDTLAGPRVLMGMWGMVEDWAKEHGAGYFYANIHPGNQPSVRAAKRIGFKHHYTQFYRPIELETTEEL